MITMDQQLKLNHLLLIKKNKYIKDTKVKSKFQKYKNLYYKIN